MLDDPLVVVKFAHTFSAKEKGGSITNIIFSNRGCLFYQVVTNDEVVYYKLDVKRDLLEERGRSPSNKDDDEQLIDQLLNADDADGNKIEDAVKTMPKMMDYVEEIFRLPKGRISTFFDVWEEELFNHKTDIMIVGQE